MKPVYPDNPSFQDGNQIFWDSTSLDLAKTCAQKYNLTMRWGFKKKVESVDLIWGLLLHKGLEVFARCQAEKRSFTHSLNEALLFVIEEAGEREKKKWLPQERFLQSTSPEDNKKNLYTLLRALIWYFNDHKNDALKTVILQDGKPAVELSFRFNLPAKTASGITYVQCGHIDRLGTLGTQTFIVDAKSTKGTIGTDFFSKYHLSNQMSCYDVAGSVVWFEDLDGVIIDAVQVAVNFSRFDRGMTKRSEFRREQWIRDAVHKIKEIEQLVESYGDSLEWPMNDTACNYYGGCPMKDACAAVSLSARKQILRTDFKQDIWNPSKSREV